MSDTSTKLLHTMPEDFKPDAYWTGIQLPFNDEAPDLQFVNPVVVAEWFARKTADIARLSGLAEDIEEEVANFKVHLRRREADLKKLSRKILASNYGAITKSADKVIQDAFVLKMAETTGKGEELREIEEDIEELRRRIEVREPRRDQFYARLKALKDSQESARQFLDFSKLEMRINHANNGGRPV